MKGVLDKHLVAKTRPIARKENMVLWENYRVTVLLDRLFRIEYSENKKFRDGATQTVWFRDTQKQSFVVVQEKETLIIKTNACKLMLYKNKAENRVEMDGKLLPISNDGNLSGTYRTLDGSTGDWSIYVKGPIPLGNGVCSKSGVAVLDDSQSLVLKDDGQVASERADGSDEYVFAYGNDYRGAVKALYVISGSSPLVPRFALGNWWSRYHDYTQDEYIRLMNLFADRDIPLTVATVDMDWHYSHHVDEEIGITAAGRNTEYYTGKCYAGRIGWTGYTWNKRLFYDYKKFLKDLKAKGLRVTLNLHPADGVRYWDSAYEDMAKALGKNPETGEAIKFDVTNADYVNAYFKYLHKPYEEDGVDFWWMDWQQGTESGIDGLDPLWALNHYHYYDNAENHFSPMFLSRYSGVGSHRYPLGFSGDTSIEWETLEYLPYFTATASNVGYTWWSHDIGGHHFGKKDDELFVRMLQYGVFSPINRLHGTSTPTLSKEPWLYENGTGLIAAEWLRLRHKLIPYLYSASYGTWKNGVPLIEPLYYEWDLPEAYKYRNEYLYGGQLLVIPITTPVRKDGYARVRAWIPEGEWTDIFTGDKYIAPVGGMKRTLLRKMDSIPVLARAGGVLPLSADKGNSIKNPEKLEVCVWSGNGAFELFEDGRVDENTKESLCVFTTNFTEADGVCTQTLRIKAMGDVSVIPKNRRILVSFKDVDWGYQPCVYANGREVQTEGILTECAAVEFAFDSAVEYQVKVVYKSESWLEKVKNQAKEILLRAEASNMMKSDFYAKILKAESVVELTSLIKLCELSDGIKQKLLEIL